MGTPIGSVLRAARERAGWSREALAYRSGLSYAAIAQIESGRRQDIRIASLAALANALGVSIDYLVSGRGRGSQLLEHRVFTYDSDSHFLTTVVPYLRDGVSCGDAVLAVTTSPQIRRLRTALGQEAAGVDFRSSAGWYRSPLKTLIKYLTYLEERLDQGAPWIRILGEPIWQGRSEAEMEEWVRYEAIINLSLAAQPATILCPYDTRSVPSAVVAGVQQTHPEMATGAHVKRSPAYRPEAVLISRS